MINFSGISQRSLAGKLFRFPLRFIPKSMIVPILQGKIKGKKWIVGSSNHGCWLGSYEYEKQILFTKVVKEGSVVYDIGAHVGFYTLLASELVGPKGKVIAFEPYPRNLEYLKRHLQLNKCNNVTVIEAAVAEQSGIGFFEEGDNSTTGHLSSNSKHGVKVKTVSLDDLVLKKQIPPPDYMKIDVEGAELLVFKGARLVLINYYPTIFLATHGVEVHKECCEFLKEIGYNLQSINEESIEKTDEILAFKEK